MNQRVSESEWAHLHRTWTACPRCAHRLVLRRAQISPPAWGAPLITEWYTCARCEAHYAYSPTDGLMRAAGI
jgi:DNA-directed RNA polymerase subunit RPC12/RpoP